MHEYLMNLRGTGTDRQGHEEKDGDRERRAGVGTGRGAERQGQKDRGKDGERDRGTTTE